VLQPSQPLSPAGQRLGQRYIVGSAVLAVLGLVDGRCLGEQLGDLRLKMGVGAVGRSGSVGLDLGAIQGNQAQADHPGRRAQLQRLDQQPGQGLFVADPEASDGHVIGCLVAAEDAEGDVFVAAPLDLAGGADPGAVGITAGRPAAPWAGRRPGHAHPPDRP
jgi:hypothetical protein